MIEARVRTLAEAFHKAIAEWNFKGSYRGVFPVKVNQQRHVVEDVVRYGAKYHMGLDAGSKPELLIVMAMLSDPEAVIICNGYKDAAYVRLALRGVALGKKVFLIVEKPQE
ncbi:MAG: arginine decarboxylase, partial [bacterium]